MKVTTKKITDLFFSLFVISSIVMSSSPIGKGFQLGFTALALFLSIRCMRVTFYHILEWIFVIYIFIQCIFRISEVSEATSRMALTMTYTSIFSLGLYHYFLITDNVADLIKRYADATVIGLLMVAGIYWREFVDFRVSAKHAISLFGITLFGGSASTALAIQAAIPAFFLIMFPPKEDKKKAMRYVFFFAAFALITGTRKILILFAFILFIESELVKSSKKRFKLLKGLVVIAIMSIVGYLLVMNVSFLYSFIGNRIESMIKFYLLGDLTDSSLRVRSRMIRASLTLFESRPYFGWGMDYFKYSGLIDLGYYSHNNFLEILTGGGIVGFILYYSKYIYLLVVQIKLCHKQRKKRDKWTACIIFCLLMIFLEYWQITYFYRFIMIYQFILLAVVKKEKHGIRCL